MPHADSVTCLQALPPDLDLPQVRPLKCLPCWLSARRYFKLKPPDVATVTHPQIYTSSVMC